MSGQFPLAPDLGRFWRNVEEGRSCIRELPAGRRQEWESVYDDRGLGAPIFRAGYLDGIADFDPALFAISPRDATFMDPQQRLLLLHLWRALEDAGIAPAAFAALPTGVFTASDPGEYEDLVARARPRPLDRTAAGAAVTPNRIAQVFDLQGPCMSCLCACASTFVALHHAVQSLHSGECAQAVVAAANLALSPTKFRVAGALGNLSPSGEVRPFQAGADGYLRGEGVGVLVLKTLDGALAAGDRIHGLIRGVGVWHGGRGRSLTAPNPGAMRTAMVRAYRAAGVDPRTVSYLEAHGTGLPAGDALEIEAFAAARRELLGGDDGTDGVPVTIGSVKPVIGNGEISSGMAQLIKVLLALRQRTIPAIAGLDPEAVRVSLAGTPFRLAGENLPWEPLHDAAGRELPRRASVATYSVAGISGHVVLEEHVAGDGARQRASLPAHPFALRPYWVEVEPLVVAPAAGGPPSVGPTCTPGADAAPEHGWRGHLVRAVAEILGVAEVAAGEPLADLGFSSLHAVTLKSDLEARLGVEAPIELLDPYQSLDELAAALEQRLAPAAASPAPLLPRVEPEPEGRFAPFPLTDLQESFLLGRRLGPEAERVGCHLYLALRFEELDIHRLDRAWNRLIAHHDMLRTVVTGDGEQQVLERVPAYRIRTVDLRQRSAEERAAYLRDVRDRMSHRVYEPGRWPLFEVRVSVCPDGCIVHLSVDELVLDASGLELLLRQWRRLLDEPGWALPDPGVSFRDYVLAVKRFDATARSREDLEWWVTELSSLPAGPTLPARAAGSAASNRFTRLSATLEEPVWRALEGWAQQLQVSPSALLLGVFSRVLGACCQQERFALILTLANRLSLHPGLRQVLGPFLSTSLFVVRDEGAGLEDHVRRVQTQLWEGLDHGRVSGVRVLRELRSRKLVASDLTLPVVFTSLLEGEAGGGFDAQVIDAVSQTPQVDLDHQVYERDGHLRLSWDVRRDRFAPGAVEALFASYCGILRRLAEGPGGRAGLEVEAEAAAALEAVRLAPDPFPLTDQQQAYAFDRSRFGGGAGAQTYLELDAVDLDVGRLEQAWNRLLAVHEMLATVVHPDGRAQLLQPVPHHAVALADLRGMDPGAREAELLRIERDMLARVCPLGEWPNFELRVSLLDDTCARIHLAVDMIVADYASVQRLAEELLSRLGRPDETPEAPTVSFRDYVVALGAHAGSAAARASRRYWERRLAELPAAPELPGLASPARAQSVHLQGSVAGFEVLLAAARRLSVSPGAILLAAYAEVLAAWSPARPFSVVVASWERLPLHFDLDRVDLDRVDLDRVDLDRVDLDRVDLDRVVGDFTALSWLVVEPGRRSFEERAREAHRAVQADLAHRAVSGLQVLRRRGLPLPVVFTDLPPRAEWRLPAGVGLRTLRARTPRVHLDCLTAVVDDRLDLHWEVAAGGLPEPMAAEMFAGYRRLLAALLSDPSWSGRTGSSSGGRWLDDLIRARPECFAAAPGGARGGEMGR